MTVRAMHLNLLGANERRSASPIRAHVLGPVAAGVVCAFVLLWAIAVAAQLLISQASLKSAQKEIAACSAKTAQLDALKAKFRNLQAEDDQFAFYLGGRDARGELLRRVAYAVPDGVSLTELHLPPPPPQNLHFPPAMRLPPLQGPTNSLERAELRLVGLARDERRVFDLMDALKGAAFTGMVVIAENAAPPAKQSPQVVEFRQDAALSEDGDRAVYFDVVYQLEGRKFSR